MKLVGDIIVFSIYFDFWLPCTNVPVGIGPIPVANPRTVGDQKNDESRTTFGDGEYCQ